jgi:hypothetical protein
MIIHENTELLFKLSIRAWVVIYDPSNEYILFFRMFKKYSYAFKNVVQNHYEYIIILVPNYNILELYLISSKY